MDEIIEKLINANSLSELENIDNIDANYLLYAISKADRYDLLKESNIRLNINNRETLGKLIDYLLSDEDYLYYMHRNGFLFSKEELNAIFNIVFEKYQYSYKLDCFFRDFFGSKEELSAFVKDHIAFFEKYIQERQASVASALKDCDSFVELVLKGDNTKLINNLENYSLENLKLLVKFIEHNRNIPNYVGNYRFADHLFELKSYLEPSEFCTLLNLLIDRRTYDIKFRNSENSSFYTLISDNIDFLIGVVSQANMVPMCIAESSLFRDECIKRNRIDLAAKCILPSDIMKNESLVSAYCKELNVDYKDFYERIKWLLNYHEKNSNIFNTFVATSLKNKIFNLNEEHFERFINDVSVQISIANLNDKELDVLAKILNIYKYKDYDITLMIINVINNISNYHELVNSLDIENIKEEDLRRLVSVFQLPDNQYHINSLSDLKKYDDIKRQDFLDSYSSSDLLSTKDKLLKVFFNIDLKEAKYIDSKYCHDNDNNNVLPYLANSELPQPIYKYLVLINQIIECDSQAYLFGLYNDSKENKIYDLEIPLELYLRAQYTELYSKSLYRIDEKNQVYGPKDNILTETNYNGNEIQICIPRVNFNFLIHCVGSCSLASDVIDANYRNDWCDRPQIQDHFVACSYINEKGFYSIRSQGCIILGFDTLENGSILGMGNTDIDSIGSYAETYAGSRDLQFLNGGRARFFVPSEMLKTIHNEYNEIVIERRNINKSRSEGFKKEPDYIIMMAESMEQENFNYLEDLFHSKLSFISEEDKKEILEIGNPQKLKDFLKKYTDVISRFAMEEGMSLNDMMDIYINLIINAKYYEDCLKAASEFNIPLVIIDKTYYFYKILRDSSLYDEETMNSIFDFYKKSNSTTKKYMYNKVTMGKDIRQYIGQNRLV